mgnify:CR=1 FL=1
MEFELPLLTETDGDSAPPASAIPTGTSTIAASLAVLDVMLKPGFFDHVQKMSLLLKQKLASVVDRYPTVLAEVRG